NRILSIIIHFLNSRDDAVLAIGDEEGYLARFNMRLTNFESPGLGLDAIKTGSFDLLILDLTLPDMDGLEVCKKVKDLSDLPVIIFFCKK
ncbi:MAG: response regulator, partial [Dissulfurimicrobium sp.]|uniref:response regulator n=1 Tax=Dissulfurimicrobium sp. TaxID=2022436 RepID=UPI00404B2B12